MSSVPRELSSFVTDERYEAHGEESHAVWREVLRRNDALIREHAGRMHPAYVEGRRALALPDRVPRVEQLNERLESTGWRIVPVAGYIPSAAYVGLMARSIFPVSRVIRRAEHIDFAPAPDLVHDVLGHLPLLFSPEYRGFLRRLAEVMTQAIPNQLDQEFYDAVRSMADIKSDPASPAAQLLDAEARMSRVNRAIEDCASEATHLRRMYVWSVEFGLLGNRSAFSIHGAALLSSPNEFRAACAGRAAIEPYSIAVIQRENAFSDMLHRYYVAEDFSHLVRVLEEYHARMRHRAAELRSG